MYICIFPWAEEIIRPLSNIRSVADAIYCTAQHNGKVRGAKICTWRAFGERYKVALRGLRAAACLVLDLGGGMGSGAVLSICMESADSLSYILSYPIPSPTNQCSSIGGVRLTVL